MKKKQYVRKKGKKGNNVDTNKIQIHKSQVNSFALMSIKLVSPWFVVKGEGQPADERYLSWNLWGLGTK
jgi:hypothetical protein